MAIARRPGEDAIAAAFAQLSYGEAAHVGVVGVTGAGKTTLIRHAIEYYLHHSGGSVIIVDDKDGVTKFEGQYRRDVEDLREHPVDYQGVLRGRVIVLRGEVPNGIRVDLETVARLAWARSRRGRKTLLVYDELVAGREETLCKNQQWRKGVTWVPRGFTLGRTPGISHIWGAQLVQDVPKEPFDESSTIFSFKLAGLGLATLKRRDFLSGGAEEIVPQLAGPPLPPSERGEFVALHGGVPWNQEIYKFREG